ncbi:MAG: tyrosine-type recombinase/integrase [Paracoccaceae bacterium]|nr:tyrosine-type recombinase/integrase [Paracoccaceae bacterium]
MKGFKVFTDRHGKLRCYHRATGHKVDLEKAPFGSAEFFAECERIAALAEAKKAREPKPGTLGGLLKHYFATDHFAQRADATKRDYRKCADFLKPIEDTPVSSIDTPLIAGIHDRAAAKIGWRRANMVRTLLSEVFKHGIPHGLIDKNYAKDVIQKKRPKDAGYANRPWNDAERAAVLDRAPAHLRAVVALIMNTGLDPSDAIKLRRDKIDGDVIWGMRGKTGVEYAVPIGRSLREAMKAAPAHDAVTILANSYGRPWTYDGLQSSWQRFKKSLEKKQLIEPGLTLKGLRHTIATVLREAGMDERAIADLLGQKTTSMAGHYSRNANLAARNKHSIEQWEKENKRRSKTVKPFPKSVKP